MSTSLCPRVLTLCLEWTSNCPASKSWLKEGLVGVRGFQGLYRGLGCLLGVPSTCLRPVSASPDSGTPSSLSASATGSSVECARWKSTVILLHFLPEPVAMRLHWKLCAAGIFPSKQFVSSCICVMSMIALSRNPIHLGLSFFLIPIQCKCVWNPLLIRCCDDLRLY